MKKHFKHAGSANFRGSSGEGEVGSKYSYFRVFWIYVVSNRAGHVSDKLHTGFSPDSPTTQTPCKSGERQTMQHSASTNHTSITLGDERREGRKTKHTLMESCLFILLNCFAHTNQHHAVSQWPLGAVRLGTRHARLLISDTKGSACVFCSLGGGGKRWRPSGG